MRMIPAKWLAVGLLAIMIGLMVGASLQDSATVDETGHLALGYINWNGARTRLGAEMHPPLASLVVSFPLLFMNVKLSDTAQAMVQGELGYPWTPSWQGTLRPIQGLLVPGCRGQYVRIPPLGDTLIQWQSPTTYPVDNWYYRAMPEGQMFGKVVVYGGANNGDAMLLLGRLAQILLSALTGVVIFFWARRVAVQENAAVLALALWVFNPIALAYGHVVNTDIGATLGITLALYRFGRLLEQPTMKNAAWAGVATGLALAMKLTALMLAPIFLIGLLLSWKRIRPSLRDLGRLSGVFFLLLWAVLLVIYRGHAAPAPPPTAIDLATFEIPAWFQALRPVLVPSGLFKDLAIALAQSHTGWQSYFLGEWSQQGWWYFFPVAFLLKEPVAFVILVGGGLFLFLRNRRSTPILEQLTWLSAGVYLASAMTSHFNIGVRHLMPMLPTLAVGIAGGVARLTDRRLRVAALALTGWMAITALLAYPMYIQFFSEAVGGARNGYKYMFDSNCDWGQDANRLKTYLDTHGIQHIYLDYHGTQFSIEHLKISNTRVSPETAKQIRQGVLVVSVSELLRPEWSWLRESRQPVDRIAHTLFVYQFP